MTELSNWEFANIPFYIYYFSFLILENKYNFGGINSF